MAGMWHGDLQGGPFTTTVNFIEHFRNVCAARRFRRAHVLVRWRHCGALAAPALAFLEIAAAGVVHVRFDGLGPVSLCRRRARRHRDRTLGYAMEHPARRMRRGS